MKHILLVEDEASHAELICRGLAVDPAEFTVTTLRTLQEARGFLSRQQPDLVLADYRLPDGCGDELVRLSAGSFPVVLLTAYGSERAAVEAIQAGALDYVVKSPETFADMVHVANRALRAWEHLVEHRRAEERLARVNQCLLGLGSDFAGNASRIAALAGELLHARFALYSRSENGRLIVVGGWQVPDGFPDSQPTDGSLCQEAMAIEPGGLHVVSDFAQSRHAEQVPSIRAQGIQTYLGQVVRCGGQPKGCLCSFFDRPYQPSDSDQRLLGILASALGVEETRRQAEQRLESLNRCLLGLGPDFEHNAGQLVSFLGRELGARMALYNRQRGDLMQVTAQWQRPQQFPEVFPAIGSVCQQTIKRGTSEAFCIPDLSATEFAGLSPILQQLSLRSYVGHAVTCAGEPVGSLCVLFDRVHQPSEGDMRLLAILALALSGEESRHEGERRLRESEQQYRALFELAPSNIVVVDSEGLVLDANPAFCRRMGFHRSELIGSPVNRFSQESAEQVQANIRRLLAGEVLEHEVTNVRKDGTRRHYELRETAIALAHGKRGILAVSNDITERRHAEEALERLAAGAASQSGEGFFELLVRNLAGALGTKYALVGEIIGTDASRVRTLAVWAGDRFHENFEYDLAGTPCGNVVRQGMCLYPDKVAELFPADDLLAQMGAFSYMGAPLFDDQHRPLGILAVMHDHAMQAIPKAESILTVFATRAGVELQRAQDATALRESETRFRTLFQSIPTMAIQGYAPDGTIQYWNQGSERVYGYTETEAVGRSLLELIIPREMRAAVRAAIQQMAETGQAEPARELMLQRKDGSLVSVYSSNAVVRLPGRAPMLYCMDLDLSERKHAEQERLEMERRLLHSQKLESLGVLAGGIAHDFNNLLTAILGNLEIAQMDIDESSPAQSSLREVAIATRRAADLTRQMLAYSGRGRFMIKALDLSELVNEMAQLLKVSIAKTATLQLRLDRKLPRVLADAAQVQQIVMNLITNASEALGETVGTMIIETSVRMCSEAYLAESRLAEKAAPGRYVCLQVSDTGCGMDETIQQRLFDPFFTTKFTGRGLGMSAVLGVVRGHRGAIMVSSVVNQGTTISVLLPAEPEAAAGNGGTEARGSALPVPAAQLTGTVLLAEDEESIRTLIVRVLTRQGLRVLAACDGEEAVELFRQNAAEVKLAILDLTMPKLDGIKVLAELRRLRPDIKAVLASGYDADEIGKRYAQEGLADFIQKPFQLEALLTIVRRWCTPP